MNFQRKMMGILLMGLCGLASLPAATNEPPRYRLVRLDEFVDHDGSADLLLNNRGQVTVMVHDEDATPRLFIRGRNRTVELPLPAGTSEFLTLAGRTAHGTILFRHAVKYSAHYYRQGKMFNLSNALPYKYFNIVAMNSRGRIVGGAQRQDGPPITAFSYYRGRHKELGTLLPGTSSFACAVNNRGQVVGAAQYQTNLDDSPILLHHAVIFKKNGVEDLGALEGASTSIATGINDRGTVIGYSSVSQTTEDGPISYRRGFVYRDGVMQQLYPLPGHVLSEPKSINRRNQIVGYSSEEFSEVGDEQRAVLFLNGETFDLNNLIPPDSEVELREALSINDRGVIAAIGNFGESFLLIPE
jgi:probable HAF family extracellular repeat protein